MKIDLHIHSKDCSDGKMPLSQIFIEANKRGIDLISITDHDNIDCQESAATLALENGMDYLTGVELNISFPHPAYRNGKPASLDVLGYGYDSKNNELSMKLNEIREYRRSRAEKILEKLNQAFVEEGLDVFTKRDMEAIEERVEGSIGRPHIAAYLVEKGIVSSKQEAFDTYLVKCNIPKLPLSLEEASNLIRGAGGKLFLAHPDDPNGTSLRAFTSDIEEQQRIIKETMLSFLDGIECWHFRHPPETVASYLLFVEKEKLLISGGSDCHQDPVVMGEVNIPSWVAEQFAEDINIAQK